MHGQEPYVFIFGEKEQAGTHQRAACEVEGAARVLNDQTPGLCLALFQRQPGEVYDRQAQCHGRGDDLDGLLANDVECRPHDLMASDALAERSFERSDRSEEHTSELQSPYVIS